MFKTTQLQMCLSRLMMPAVRYNYLRIPFAIDIHVDDFLSADDILCAVVVAKSLVIVIVL